MSFEDSEHFWFNVPSSYVSEVCERVMRLLIVIDPVHARLSRDRIPVRARFPLPFYTGPETYQASCRSTSGIPSLFRGKAVGACC